MGFVIGRLLEIELSTAVTIAASTALHGPSHSHSLLQSLAPLPEQSLPYTPQKSKLELSLQHL